VQDAAIMKWRILDKTPVYDGFFKLSRLRLQHDKFDGDEDLEITRELIDKGHAVGVLPYDPVRDEVVLVEQFRVGACEDESLNGTPWLIEVIAGYKESGESAEAVAIREAIEEADCHITDVQLLHQYYSSAGGSNEIIHVFFALTDTQGLGGIHGLDEEHEDIRVHVVSSEQAFKWLDSGRIDSAMPIIALQWFRMNRDRIRAEAGIA
jgi:ADP-ribose pyrophosphatase